MRLAPCACSGWQLAPRGHFEAGARVEVRSALSDDGFQGSWAAAVVLRWREVPRAAAEAGAELDAADAAASAAGRYAYDVEYTEFVLEGGEKMVRCPPPPLPPHHPRCPEVHAS